MSVKKLAIVINIVCLIVNLFVFSVSLQRASKSAKSNFGGGLNRTITLYDNTGNMLAEYECTVDIAPNSTSGKILFDRDGKQIKIYSGIIIVQEK